jgi:hypothetical protein
MSLALADRTAITSTETAALATPIPTPAQQLRSFLAKFDPRVAASARAALSRLRKKLPGATELVYDNYNALAIGFGPSEKASEAIFSIAVFPRWVSLFFLQGARLPDPDRVLNGSGTQVRHIVLTDLKILEQPAVKKLMAVALKSAKKPLDSKQRRRLIIKSISARQRPMRP